MSYVTGPEYFFQASAANLQRMMDMYFIYGGGIARGPHRVLGFDPGLCSFAEPRDPNAYKDHDGWWKVRQTSIPCETVNYNRFEVPYYPGDAERRAYDARVAPVYRRPHWLREHGVAL